MHLVCLVRCSSSPRVLGLGEFTPDSDVVTDPAAAGASSFKACQAQGHTSVCCVVVTTSSFAGVFVAMLELVTSPSDSTGTKPWRRDRPSSSKTQRA